MNEIEEHAELLVKNALGLEWNLESNPEKVKAVAEILQTIASQPVIDGFYLYLLIIEDDHYDDEYTGYTSSELAIQAARDYVKEWEDETGYEFEDYEVDDPDWLFCQTAGESYAVIVRRVKVEG